jgi:hypothetical protein
MLCFHCFNIIDFLHCVIAKQKIITKEKGGGHYHLSLSLSNQPLAADVYITLCMSSPQILAAVPRIKCVGQFSGAS